MFDCPVNIPVPVMMHDLQITADYAIILDTCVEFSPKVRDLLVDAVAQGLPVLMPCLELQQDALQGD